jgi:hypothetical protein
MRCTLPLLLVLIAGAVVQGQVEDNTTATGDDSSIDRAVVSAFANRWQDCRAACLGFKRAGSDSPPLVIRWLDQICSDRTGESPVFEGNDSESTKWMHPLSEELDRQAFGIVSEIQTLLEAGQWNAVAEMVADPDVTAHVGLATAPDPSTGSHSQSGVDARPSEQPANSRGPETLPAERLEAACWALAVPEDDRLLVSLPTVLRRVLEDYPEVVAQLDAHHGERIELVVRQAQRSGQLDIVQRLARQYVGTRVANLAWQWLGDQSLVRGDWLTAVDCYQRMASHPESANINRSARLQLAKAMEGFPPRQPIGGDVQIGDEVVSADGWNQLMESLATHHQTANSPSNSSGSFEAQKADLASVDCHLLSLPLDVFQSRQSTSSSRTGQRTDGENFWDDRWEGSVAGDRLILNRRREIVAIDLQHETIAWASRLRKFDAEKMASWGQVRMRPVVAGPYLVTRRVIDGATVLECRWLQTGRLCWMLQPDEREFVSDPWYWEEKLACFTMGQPGGIEDTLTLSWFDVNTGELISESSVVRLRGSWWDRRCCESRLVGNHVYVTLGGAAFCTNVETQLSWLRTRLVLPPAIDSDVPKGLSWPMVVDGEQAFVVQPGVWAVESLDVTTGRQLWSLAIPRVLRVVAVFPNILVVETRDGLWGIDRTTGMPSWRNSAKGQTIVIDQGDGFRLLLFTRAISLDGDLPDDRPTAIQFCSVDVATGELRTLLVSEQLSGTTPSIQPVGRDEDNQWLLFNDDAEEAKPRLVRLQLNWANK